MTSNIENPVGKPISKHLDRRLTWNDLLTTFFPAFIVIILLISAGGIRKFFGYKYFGPIALTQWGNGFIYLALILLVPVWIYTYSLIRRSHRKIIICTEGLKIQGFGTRTILYDQIVGLAFYEDQTEFINLRLSKIKKLYVFIGNKKRVILSDKVGIFMDIVNHLKSVVYPRILPSMREAWRLNLPLYFGKVTLSTQRIEYHSDNHPWDNVKEIAISDGAFRVDFIEGNSWVIPLSQVTNYELLFMIIKP